MKDINPWWGFWIPFILCLVIGASVHVEKNQNGNITVRECVESSGPQRPTANGDGPECERYGLVQHEESEIRSAFRGVGEGLIPGAIIGFIGFYCFATIQDRINKKSD